MIRIALCDDDTATLQHLSKLLQQYQKQKNVRLSCSFFSNPMDLLDATEDGECFDVLFLDVLMPGENGIDTAAELRRFDSNVKIIFLSVSPEYAIDSYTVDAFYYLLKPIGEEELYPLMDKLLASWECAQSNGVILHCKNGITRIDPSKIEYCEVIHRTLFLHLSDGTVPESIGSMESMSRQLLPYGKFLRIHRSYLINLDFVEKLSFRAVKMLSGIELPIPRGKYNEIKNQYLAYAFDHKWVQI